MQTAPITSSDKEPPSINAMCVTAVLATFGAAIANPGGPPVTPSAIPAAIAIALYRVATSETCRDLLARQWSLVQVLFC